jgi:dihydroorotase
MTGYRLRGGLVVDPFQGVAEEKEIVVVDGRVAGPGMPRGNVETVDVKGTWVVPRITDLHVHFRDPGQTWKEDWASGVRAAAAGGVTTVGVMPNTVPVVDTPRAVREQIEKGAGRVRVWPIAALSLNSRGEEAAPWDALHLAGARAFSDDGRALYHPRLMAEALQWSARSGAPVIQHLEDPLLSEGGVAQEGEASRRLGLLGQPEASESVLAFRDVALAAEYGGHLHLAHCSVPGTLKALSWARAEGLLVSGEATPHHCLLSDEILLVYGRHAVTKVNPPIRSREAKDAIRRALVSGLITVMASDHAPHAADEKAVAYEDAPFGISGIETLLAATITVLFRDAGLPPLQVMAPLTSGPHAVVGQTFPGLVPGAEADLTVIDPTAAWTVDPTRFQSRGQNTPLAGLTLQGRVVATMVGGRFTFRDGEVLL